MTGNMRQSHSSLGGRTGLSAQTAHSDVTVTTLLARTPQPMVPQVLHQVDVIATRSLGKEEEM